MVNLEDEINGMMLKLRRESEKLKNTYADKKRNQLCGWR